MNVDKNKFARAITIEFTNYLLPFLTYPSGGCTELYCLCLFDHHYCQGLNFIQISRSVEMGEQGRAKSYDLR